MRLNVPIGSVVDLRDVYHALSTGCKIARLSISKNNLGDIIVSFRSSFDVKNLVQFPTLRLPESGKVLSIFDPAKPVIFFNIYNLPYEMSDEAVRKKLSVFGDILSFKRNTHAGMPTIEDGVRQA